MTEKEKRLREILTDYRSFKTDPVKGKPYVVSKITLEQAVPWIMALDKGYSSLKKLDEREVLELISNGVHPIEKMLLYPEDRKQIATKICDTFGREKVGIDEKKIRGCLWGEFDDFQAYQREDITLGRLLEILAKTIAAKSEEIVRRGE